MGFVARTLRVCVVSTLVSTAALGIAEQVALPAAAVAPVVSVVGSSTMVRPTFDATGSSSTAQLTAARNEFESFQVVVTAGATARSQVSVGMQGIADGPLVGPGGTTIPASAVTVYREGYYSVTRPSDGELWQVDPCPSDCRVPDVLIPERDPFFPTVDRNAFPVDVPAGEIRVAWVDVLVPKDQPAGNYTGALSVRNATGTLGTVTISLRVLNFELPSTSTLRGAQATDFHQICAAHTGNTGCTGGDPWPLYSRYAQAALDNRVTLSMPGYNNPENWGSNLSLFRQYAEPLLTGTAPTRLPGAKMTDVVLNRYEAEAMDAWKTEGVRAGFASRITFYCDEMGQDPAKWTALCNTPYLTARDAWNSAATNPDPGPLPVAFTGSKYDLDYARSQDYAVANAITTLIPVVNYMHPNPNFGTYPGQQFAGNQRSIYNAFLNENPAHSLWMYPSCMSSGCTDPYTPSPVWSGWPSYHIDQPPAEARAMGWQDFIYDVSGDYHFQTVQNLPTAWNTCTASPPTNCQYNEGANGDGTLFYPGTPAKIGGPAGSNVPVESIRLKRIRDGREDYEYLHWLSVNGKDSQARAIATQLFPTMYQSVASQSAIDSARAQLATLVDAPANGADVSVLVGAPPSLFVVGDVAVYTVAVTNTGPESAAVSAKMSLAAPPYAVATTTAGTCGQMTAAFDVTCSLGTVAAGGKVTVKVSVPQAHDGATSFTAQVTSAGDPNAANNSKTINRTVSPALVGWPLAKNTTFATDCTITGTAAADVLTGTSGDDTICGFAGADTMTGLAGSDKLLGGTSNDMVSYSTAAGPVVANLTHQDAYVPPGSNSNTGDDYYRSVEMLRGSAYADTLFGSATADRLYGLSGSDTMYGYAGNDRLYGSGGNDNIRGGDGDDTLTGDGGDDILNGEGGTDTCTGGTGTNTLTNCER